MEQVNVWKCSFCKKTSFHKGTIRKHERECFYNPETRSCASCLWFSPIHGIWPLQCFINTTKEIDDNSKQKLETQCKRWIDVATIEEIDIWDEQYRDIFNLLLNGNGELIHVLKKLKGELSDV